MPPDLAQYRLHTGNEGRVAEVHGADVQTGDDIGQGLDEEASTVFQVGRFDAAAGNGVIDDGEAITLFATETLCLMAAEFEGLLDLNESLTRGQGDTLAFLPGLDEDKVGVEAGDLTFAPGGFFRFFETLVTGDFLMAAVFLALDFSEAESDVARGGGSPVGGAGAGDGLFGFHGAAGALKPLGIAILRLHVLEELFRKDLHTPDFDRSEARPQRSEMPASSSPRR